MTYQPLQENEDALLTANQLAQSNGQSNGLSNGQSNDQSNDQSNGQQSLKTDQPTNYPLMHQTTAEIAPECGPSEVSGASRVAGWLSGPKGLIVGLALGLGLAFAASQLMSSRSEPAAGQGAASTNEVASATVTTARAQQIPILKTIKANGTVEAYDLLAVAPRASGLQILTVNVREGDRVSAGQVLAVLDDSVLQAQIAQAQAEVSAAQAQVAQAQAQADQARAALSEAQESFDRYSALFNQGAISQEELTSRRTQVATQTQTVSAAIAAIESAQAGVRSRQADLERLRTQLGQTQVLAPTSGIIAKKNATVGDTANPGTPLFELIGGDQLELSVKIPETQLPQVKVGSPVQITADADASIQLRGSVRSIDPTLDPQTRQATVKVDLPESDQLRPGMFLSANIVTSSRQGVAVPATALVYKADGQAVVFSLQSDGTVTAQPVEPGERLPKSDEQPERIEIRSGLKADVPVVVEGASYLQDGDRVAVVEESVQESVKE